MKTYRKFTLDAPGVKVLNHDITPGANPKNGGGSVNLISKSTFYGLILLRILFYTIICKKSKKRYFSNEQ